MRYHTLLAEEAGGLTDRWDGVQLAVTRSPIVGGNAGFVTGVPKDSQTIPKLIARLRDANVPFTVRVADALVDAVENQLRVAGLGPPTTAPGMRVEIGDLRESVTPGVSVRRVSDALARDAWIGVVAAAAEVERPVITALTPATLLRRPGLELWLAEEDGLPVAATATLTLNGVTGVYGLSVPGEHRGRGVGASTTSGAIVGAASLHPAKRAAVMASPASYQLYRRLGFQTVRPYRIFPSASIV